jgi:hypothetical protein
MQTGGLRSSFEGFGLVVIIQAGEDFIHVTIHDAIQLIQRKLAHSVKFYLPQSLFLPAS